MKVWLTVYKGRIGGAARQTKNYEFFVDLCGINSEQCYSES